MSTFLVSMVWGPREKQDEKQVLSVPNLYYGKWWDSHTEIWTNMSGFLVSRVQEPREKEAEKQVLSVLSFSMAKWPDSHTKIWTNTQKPYFVISHQKPTIRRNHVIFDTSKKSFTFGSGTWLCMRKKLWFSTFSSQLVLTSISIRRFLSGHNGNIVVTIMVRI